MKIKREVKGQTMTFELTNDELYKAFDEYEHMIDVDTVDIWCSDNDGNSLIPDDKIDDVANRYRNLLDDYYNEDYEIRMELAHDAMREVLGYED